jgi:ABC-type Fe3+-hydroxamate transport system substrate-binding protein
VDLPAPEWPTSATVTTIGRVLGTGDYAAKSVASLKQTVASVTEQAKSLPKQTVSITAGLFTGSFFTYGASSIANTQITTLGLTNTFADVAKRGFSASPEEFINRNPDFLVLGYDPVTGNADKTVRDAMAVPGFATMRAVQNHHMLVMSDSFLLGRAVDGLKMIYDAIAAAK